MKYERIFPIGCYITNIHRGEGPRECFIYCELRDKDGEILISADLEYIKKQLYSANII